MITYQTGIYFISRSAQTAQNSVDELRRCLARLLILSLSSSKEDHKAIKTFLRLVTSHPIKTQAFGSIDINMSLIPKFLMILSSYTVMALQINNVV
ncbi:uncharacterized protein LOC135193429 [Vanessa tameamea]|uniref:Uncharacterized protein LOC135193429 n=1 Tax=Vanessa tameamea TaxID=334116 RepID=A0ABM4AKU3_VANTA